MVRFDKKSKAITLLEIIISITIISLLMIMLFSVIAKKAKAVAEKTSGVFYCFKDAKGELNQRVELGDGTVQEMTGINNCNFSFPNEATDFITYVIGGGGGGGKIDDSFTGYTLDSVKYYEFPLFSPTSDGCAKNPVISINGLKTEISETQYMCDDGPYNCLQGNTDVAVINDDTTLKKIFNSSAYELAVLTDRSLFIKGGNNTSNESGALCIFRADIPYGETLEYFFDGRNEYVCSTGVEKKMISASSGKFKTSHIEITAQARTFANDNYINDNLALTSQCVTTSGIYTTRKFATSTRLNDKLEYVIVKPVVQYGNGGSAGNYITNTNIKFSGKNIIIPKSNIGNGGKAGEDGQPTTFEEYNIKAQGGSAGTTETVTYEASLDNVDSGLLIKGDDLLQLGAHKYEFGPTRKQVKFAEGVSNDGVISQYATQKVLPGVVLGKQGEYTGLGSKCDAQKCTEATSARSESFGSGGGGGNTKVTYEPYYKFIYTRPDYLLNEYEYVINSVVTPTIEKQNGSAGMGGAIVITWQ